MAETYDNGYVYDKLPKKKTLGLMSPFCLIRYCPTLVLSPVGLLYNKDWIGFN